MWPFLNNVTTTCGCTHCTPSTSICYTGVNLSCIGVNKNDTLSVALQKINALMCVPITNTEIITALGYTPANDSNVVHKTGNETIAGVKVFTSTPNFNSESINIFDNVAGGYASISVADSVIYLKDYLGNKQFSAETGNSFNVYKTDVIFGNFLVTSLTAARNYTLPDASGTLALTSDIPVAPYKVYTALLTQTGTSAPVATVLENTLGVTPVWSYLSTGVYLTDYVLGTNLNKIYYSITNKPGVANEFRISQAQSGPDFGIAVYTFTSGVAADGIMTGVPIEIRVYN